MLEGLTPRVPAPGLAPVPDQMTAGEKPEGLTSPSRYAPEDTPGRLAALVVAAFWFLSSFVDDKLRHAEGPSDPLPQAIIAIL